MKYMRTSASKGELCLLPAPTGSGAGHVGLSSHCSKTVVVTTTTALQWPPLATKPSMTPPREVKEESMVCLFADAPAPTLSERARKRTLLKKRKLEATHNHNSEQLLSRRLKKQADHHARMAAQEQAAAERKAAKAQSKAAAAEAAATAAEDMVVDQSDETPLGGTKEPAPDL